MGRARELYEKALATRSPQERARGLEGAVTAAEQENDRETLGLSLLGLGTYHVGMGEHAKARDRLEVARRLLESNPGKLGECLHRLWIAMDEPAEGDLPRALDLLEAEGDPAAAGSCCGDLAFLRGDDALYAKAIEHYRKAKSGFGVSVMWHKRAKLALKQKKHEHGLWCCDEGRKEIDACKPSRSATRIDGEILETCGDLQAASGDRKLAGSCYRAAAKLLEQVGVGANRIAEKLRELGT